MTKRRRNFYPIMRHVGKEIGARGPRFVHRLLSTQSAPCVGLFSLLMTVHVRVVSFKQESFLG